MPLQQLTAVNRREVRVIGMSRSGNHAIVQWLVTQMAGDARGRGEPGARVCWLNCPEPRWNPYWTARPRDDGVSWWASYDGFDLEAEKATRFSAKDWFVFNYEDTFLRVACSPEYEREHDAWVGRSGVRRDVLILRDPFNLFASRRRSLRHGVDERTAMRIWKQHAKQFLPPAPGTPAPGRAAPGSGSRSSAAMLPHDPVLILYNRWCTDAAYRREICRRLEVPFTDAGRERVAAVHGGSSFDGLHYDGRASDMRTGERWRESIDDATYRALFDAETLQLAERIFGPLDAIAELRPRAAPGPAGEAVLSQPSVRPPAAAARISRSAMASAR